jgi:hypothetical protein
MGYRTFHALAVLLLLSGAAFEAGHLEHHVRHAGHHHDAGDPEHRACMIFHTGVVLECAPDVVGDPVVVGMAPGSDVVRPSTTDGPALPESRAPPRSS